MKASINPNEKNPNPPRQKVSEKQPFNVEIIRASTPLFLALIGGVLGMAVLISGSQSEAGFGLASTAIAGAAGLAQPLKEKEQVARDK